MPTQCAEPSKPPAKIIGQVSVSSPVMEVAFQQTASRCANTCGTNSTSLNAKVVAIQSGFIVANLASDWADAHGPKHWRA
jgi:hypothetical protein